MGLLVRIEQAARLVGKHERIIRWHIAEAPKGKGDLPTHKEGRALLIDVDDLARIQGWRVDRDLLGELAREHKQTSAGMAAEMRALRVELETLRRRVDALERARLASSASDVPRSAFSWQSDSAEHLADILEPAAEDLAVSASYGHVALAIPTGQRFSNRAEAARWLVMHGVHSETTPKSWQGWRDVPLEPRAVLRDALSRQEEAIRSGNHRVSWRLRPCGDPSCVCAEILS